MTVVWTEAEREAWRWAPPVGVADWARQHVWLTKAMGAAHEGPYDPDLTPWVHDLYAAFVDPEVEGMVFVAAAQVGKSLTVQIIIAYAIAEDPSNILYFMDTDVNAKWASKHRIQPMLDGQASVRAKIAPPRERQVLEIPFVGGVLNLAGSNSVSQLASKSAPRVIRDETSKWPSRLGDEAGALELAGERLKGQWSRKLVDISTPVMDGDPILKQYERSDKGQIFVPCPHCGHYQTLQWEQMRWPKGDDGHSVSPEAAETAAWYACAGCAGQIEEGHKRWMLRHYKRVAAGQEIVELEGKSARGVEDWTVELAGGKRCRYQMLGEPTIRKVFGLHLNRLYSPFETWGQMAKQWLDIGDDMSARQTFVNAALAQPWRVRTLKPDEHKVQGHIWAAVRPSTLPAGYDHLTVGADIQLRCVYYSVWAWREDGASHLVEYGELADITDLEHVAAETYSLASGETTGVGAMFVDTRYRGTEVEDFARGLANVYVCRGSTSKACPKTGPVAMAYVKTDQRGRKLPPHLWRAYVSVHGASFKEELHSRLETQWDGQGETPPAGYVSLHSETEMDYIEQLLAEERIEKTDIRGRVTHEWKQTRHANHYLDCRVYAAAAWRYFFTEWIRRREVARPRRVGRHGRFKR